MKFEVNQFLTGLILIVASISIIGCGAEETAGIGSNGSQDDGSWEKLCSGIVGPGGGSTTWRHLLSYDAQEESISLTSESYNVKLNPPTTSPGEFKFSLSEIMTARTSGQCVMKDFSEGTFVSDGTAFKVQIAVCLESNNTITVKHQSTVNSVLGVLSPSHCTHDL